MPVRLRERAAAPAPTTRLPSRPASGPDPGYDALSRLVRLRGQLAAALPTPKRSRWKEPPVFFFDRKRQTEFDAVRPVVNADPFAEVSASIAAELPPLYASVEVRRVARAVDGLRETANMLATQCSAARDLAELLAVPDAEVIVVLDRQRRTGFRFVARGVADVGQFHILMADAIGGEPIAPRFVAACRDVNPATPAGVPMIADARFQLSTGEGEQWLWPATPLASVPRTDGERVVLLGPPAYRTNWEVTRRFPAMPAEVRVIETLSPRRVAEWLTKLTGKPLLQRKPELSVAKAPEDCGA